MDCWLTEAREQYQEAKDQQIPFAQGDRPEVPEKPQTCASRYHEGSCTLTLHHCSSVAYGAMGLTNCIEGGEGGQARCGIDDSEPSAFRSSYGFMSMAYKDAFALLLRSKVRRGR